MYIRSYCRVYAKKSIIIHTHLYIHSIFTFNGNRMHQYDIKKKKKKKKKNYQSKKNKRNSFN